MSNPIKLMPEHIAALGGIGEVYSKLDEIAGKVVAASKDGVGLQTVKKETSKVLSTAAIDKAIADKISESTAVVIRRYIEYRYEG